MRSILNTKKKGQLNLGSAPSIVLLVGLLFLVMATVALVGEKYGGALPADNSKTVVNETLSSVNSLTTTYIADNTACNFQDFTVLTTVNATGDGTVIDSSNYTASTTGGILFIGTATGGFNNSDWNMTYSFSYSGISCNITGDLETEIGTNTSIAGIVLTISLVGIVLSILIGVFMGISRKGSRI